jgi:hypothetical protein
MMLCSLNAGNKFYPAAYKLEVTQNFDKLAKSIQISPVGVDYGWKKATTFLVEVPPTELKHPSWVFGGNECWNDCSGNSVHWEQPRMPTRPERPSSLFASRSHN